MPTRETEDDEHRRDSFKMIFDKSIWSKENPSGGGSSLKGKISFDSSLKEAHMCFFKTLIGFLVSHSIHNYYTIAAGSLHMR